MILHKQPYSDFLQAWHIYRLKSDLSVSSRRQLAVKLRHQAPLP